MRLYISLMVALAFGFNAQAQNFEWTQLNSGTTEKLNDVFFINEQIGYAVGNNGTIITTTDGGDSWSHQAAPTNDNCNAVFFLDTNTGWIAVGSTPGSIYKTVDGGQQWSQVSLPSGISSVNDVSFNSADMGWCIAYNAFFYSEDGGNTWTQASATSSDDEPRGNKQIATASDSTCYVASWADHQPVSTATVFHNTSLDFDLFSTSTNVDFESEEELQSIEFINKEIGFVGSNEGRLYKMISDGTYYSGPWDINFDVQTETSIKSISFSNADHGIFLYNYGTPIISVIGVTNNGGISWETVDTIAPFSSYAVFLSHQDLAWIVGSDGRIFKGTPFVGGASKINTLEANVFPNPSDGNNIYLQIEDADYKNSQLTICNSMGQVVHQTTLNQSLTSITTSHLPSGYFYVSVISPLGKKFNSILIQP